MTSVALDAAAPSGAPPRATAIRAEGRDRRDVAIIAGGQIFQQVLTMGTGIVIARLLGASGYGLVNLLRSLLNAIAPISPLGLDLALLKFSGQHADDPAYVSATVRRLRLLAFWINAAAALVLGVGGGELLMRYVYPYPGFDRMFLVTLIGLPLGTDVAILGAYYKGLNRAGTSALLTLYLQPTVRVILVGIAALTTVNPFVVVCINTAQLAFSAAGMFLNLRSFERRADLPTASPPGWPVLRAILSASIWMAASLLIYGMMRFFDVLLLGALATAKDVGEYGALSTVAQLVQVYPLAASQTLGPNVSRHFHAGDIDGVKRVLDRYIYMAAIIASFIFAGIAVFGSRLDLVFGHSFKFRPDVAFLMPLGYLLSATLAPMGYALSMTGRHRSETAILCLGALTLVGLCVLLIPIWGQVGAATASASSFLVINVLRYLYVARVLKFVPGQLRDLLPPFVALACAYLARLGIDAVAGRTLPATIAACLCYTFLFGLVCFGGMVRRGDRDDILASLRRRLARR